MQAARSITWQPAWQAVDVVSQRSHHTVHKRVCHKHSQPSAVTILHPYRRLHSVSPGRQPGKPLMLFLHGFPECWYSWRHQMTAFAQDYDVVAIDMRGYNTSDKPKVCRSAVCQADF